MVCGCVLVLTACMGGSGGYSGCGWVCDWCVIVVYVLLDGWSGVWKCGCVVEWMVDGVGSSG